MKKIIILGIMIILLLPYSLSWSLGKGTEVMYFEPGLEKTILFRVNNYDGPTKLFKVKVSTTSNELSEILDQVVRIREQEVMIEVGEVAELYVDIKLPDRLSHGLHDILISISDVDPNQQRGQIRIQKALGFYINVYSLYPGKLVETKFLGVDSGNIGEILYFKTQVRNIGTEDIENARAKVDVFEGDNLVGTVYSDYIPIASKEVEELKASLLITEGYKIGQYVAKAVVEYDGKTQDAEYTQIFNVGELSISILNITSRRFENNKINKFDIDVESKWNKAADVYAELVLTDFSGNDIDSFKTQTVSVEGWRKAVVPAYMDLKDIANDNYILKVILHYEGKTSRRTFAIEVSDKGEAEIVEDMPGMPKQTIIIILLSVVVVLLIVVVIMFFLHGRRRTGYERQVERREVEDNKKYNKPAEEDEGY